MGMPSWITELIGGGAAKIVDSVAGAAKQFITTDADRAAFDLEVRRAGLEVQKLEMEAESKRLQDVASARDLYKSDSSVQKIYSLAFLLGYFLLTGAMLWITTGWIGLNSIVLPDWAVSLISAIFGAMSTKVSTITDFYFGSSKGSQGKDEQIVAAFKAGKE